MLDSYIKTLIKILETSDINELEVSTFWGRQRVRLSKSIPSTNPNIEKINIPVHPERVGIN